MKTHKTKADIKVGTSYVTWLSPDTAPLNGTLILGDFGWPWPLLAVWDEYDEQWVTATLQGCPMENEKNNSYLETDTEKRSALKRWTPLPALPNDERIRVATPQNHEPKTSANGGQKLRTNSQLGHVG